jgi:transcriptional regulator with PAS, ATPase and Fis domain
MAEIVISMARQVIAMNISSLGKMLDVILLEIPSQLGAILALDPENRMPEEVVRRGVRPEKKKIPLDTIREIIENGHPLILSTGQKGDTRHIACLPLIDQGESIGCVFLSRAYDDELFTDRDIGVLAVFAQSITNIVRRISNKNSLSRTSGPNPSGFIGKSGDHHRVLRFIDCVKNNDIPVFISGESGTGKEIVARCIHHSGPRRSHKFVAVNCGAIPDHLLESELFGYARGAFTGAVREKPGLIEEANHGTFLLDEIGDLSPPLQAKLLRVIQEKEIRRVGENRVRPIDVRFISATNKDIEREVTEGRFREDLYYRLNIVSVDLSPLRKRKEDILSLVNHLVEKYCRELNRERAYFSPSALQLMLGYSWPGNVRELQNEIQRCLILCGERTLIEETFLSDKIHRDSQKTAIHLYDYFHAKAAFEKKFLNEALARSDYNRTQTAQEIGLSRQGLFKLMKKHGMLPAPKNDRI